MISRQLVLSACIAVAVGGTNQVFAQTQGKQFISIMPLGDSITESSSGYASYRYYLWQDLCRNDRVIDFVGNRSGVRGGPPLYDDFDQDHEGHAGLRADEVAAQVAGWANQAHPQIALLHLGTNDLWQGQDVPTTISDISDVIDGLRLVAPEITILLAQIIPVSASKGFDVAPLNAEIPNLAAAKDLPESPVIVVDHHTGFDPDLDTYDGVHPNDAGEIKMAQRWLEALQPLLWSASWSLYGTGHPGTLAVPNIIPNANPRIGASLSLDLSNSSGVPTTGWLLIGIQPDSTLSPWDGLFTVRAQWRAFLTLPLTTTNRLPYQIADDDALCGLRVYVQALEVDAGASSGISFTPGLELVIGY